MGQTVQVRRTNWFCNAFNLKFKSGGCCNLWLLQKQVLAVSSVGINFPACFLELENSLAQNYNQFALSPFSPPVFTSQSLFPVTCPGAHQSFVANPSTYCEPLCEPYGSNYTCTELNISNPGCRCDFGYLRYRATYECVKFTKCWYLQFTSKINYILKKISGKS